MARSSRPGPLLDLAAAHRLGPAEIGGKADGLARLHARGLPVPEALVLPTGWLAAHLDRHGLTELAAEGGPEVARAVREGDLEPALAGELRRAAGLLGDCLAVRSSAVGEDGVQHSFAGQYRTLLGVGPGDALEDAVRACWASAFEGPARTYRGQRRGLPPRMAVVVQRMVDARTAGVMFTINPLNGAWREMTIESAWGLGEAVVSGQIVPDYVRLRRPRRAPPAVRRLLARVRLEVLEERVGRQDRAWRLAPGGACAEELPEALREVPKLSRRELLALGRLGLRVEARLGGPQDIEWAQDSEGRFLVLQARPVTATGSDERSGSVVWSRRFVGERWTRPATPLGWSLMRDQLHWFIAYPEVSRTHLGGEEPSRLFRFAPYLNVTVFRHLAFKAPGAPPPRFMTELLPPDEEQSWLRRRAHPPDLAVYAAIFRTTFAERRWQRFRWNPVTNWRAWEEFEARLEGELDPERGPFAGPIRDRAQALARIGHGRELVREYIKVHICSLLFANIWYQVAEAFLNAQELGPLVPELLRPAGETWTVRTNRALWRLGRGELGLDAFLRDYGHRSACSWELSTRRWAEEPDEALALAAHAAQGVDPAIRAAEQAEASEAALARVRGRAAREAVVLARRYLTLREDQRFHFDRLLWAWKAPWDWLIEDLGLDLWMLEDGEVQSLLSGELARDRAEKTIARRREELEAERRRREQGDEPPVFLSGDQAVATGRSGGRIQGLGISPGVVTGTVRVLRSPADGVRLREGDILVAHATDPGWTPLFLRAGALVMELGGMLSHGAVVAREYGLPAVVNVVDATARLHDGQTVTVDGSRGVVWVR